MRNWDEESRPPARDITKYDPELTTRTSWVDARTAYLQITRGKATGNRRALWLRWQCQRRLFSAGCFIATHSGKVLFLGLLLLSLCCVGLKTAALETNIDKLWVEAGGRLSRELSYTMKWLGEGSGTTYELLIQTAAGADTGGGGTGGGSGGTGGGAAGGGGLLTVSSMLQHLDALQAATRLSVEVNDVTFSFNDICYATGFPALDDNSVVNQILLNLQACVIITPLDCFWEGSKLLGPDHPVYIPGLPEPYVTWMNLNPRQAVDILGKQHILHIPVDQVHHMLTQAGIEDGYQKKPCLNASDPACPRTAPNYASKQVPDIGSVLTGGCSGLSSKFMRWEQDLIVGGTQHGRTGQLTSAGAIQSLLQLMGEKDLYDYHRDTAKVQFMADWSVDKARQVLDAWRRQFTQTVLKSQNSSSNDAVYAMSSLDLVDVMDNFSQISLLRVVVGCLLMCVYTCLSLAKLNNTVQSQATVGLVGVLLVILSVAAGLGVCSVAGIKFNAATTQILPFLALGLGVDGVFLMAFTFSEMAQRRHIDYDMITGECLKRIGITILLTSLCIGFAVCLAAIVPIPAMRAFCIQCAVLVLFNVVTVMCVFPAVLSLDLYRRRHNRIDFFCCFTWATLPTDETLPSYTLPGSRSQCRDMIIRVLPDGQCVTSLAPQHHSDSQLTADSNIRHNASCGTAHCSVSRHSAKCCCKHCSATASLSRWSLTMFARQFYSRFLLRTVSKVLVVCVFVLLLVSSVFGIIRMRDGLDITDIVPRDTNEHAFLQTQSKYFGFYNFYAVTQNDFDYTTADNQKLLYSYHLAFMKIDNIIRKDDGSLPEFWLQLFRTWLIEVQSAFDDDVAAGHITRDGWNNNATVTGRLGYKLMLQTGTDSLTDKRRFETGRLVSSNGIIYPPAFYVYLSAWASNDVLAFDTSMAAIKPAPKNWVHDKYDTDLKIPKSQPIAYAQLAFYLHNLGDTDAVTATIKDLRSICETYAARGLPNYPHGVIFTFWEQYVSLRFYLAVSLAAALTGIFLVLCATLLNPWAAAVVVVVIGLIVVELFGLMGLIGIKLSAIPAVILIITAGISVEFTVHVCLSFLTSIGSSRNKRVAMSVESVFAPVTHGAVSTLLGVALLVGSQFDFIVRYFFVILSVLVVVGLLNGLVLLPVLLSTLGPPSEVVPLDNGDELPLPSPQLQPAARRTRRRERSSSDRGSVTSNSSRRSRRSGRRKAYQCPVPPDNVLSTIAEESSQHHSSSVHADSTSLSIDVIPEVVVETLPASPPPYSTGGSGSSGPHGPSHFGLHGAAGHSGPSSSYNSNQSSCPTCMTRIHAAPSTTTSTTTTTSSSLSGHHVTTIRTTARVKVEVHTPVPIISHSSPDFKSKKRKRARVEQTFNVVGSSSSIDSSSAESDQR